MAGKSGRQTPGRGKHPRKPRTKRTPKKGLFHEYMTTELARAGEREHTALTVKSPQIHECTPLTAARIAALVQSGDYTAVSAAGSLGISAKELKRWRRAAEDPTTPKDTHYRAFFATIDAASSKFQKKCMKEVRHVALDRGNKDQLKALSMLLKAVDPDSFGDRMKTELTGEDGEPIRIDQRIAVMTDQELERRLRELEAQGRGAGNGEGE